MDGLGYLGRLLLFSFPLVVVLFLVRDYEGHFGKWTLVAFIGAYTLPGFFVALLERWRKRRKNRCK